MAKIKSMKKTAIIVHIANKLSLKKKDVEAFIDALWELAIDQLKSVGEFTIPGGFGKLVLKDRKARMGRNPATGEKIKIAAKKTLKFRVAKPIKDEVLPKVVKKNKKVKK